MVVDGRSTGAIIPAASTTTDLRGDGAALGF
jgi:hypothetical protein